MNNLLVFLCWTGPHENHFHQGVYDLNWTHSRIFRFFVLTQHCVLKYRGADFLFTKEIFAVVVVVALTGLVALPSITVHWLVTFLCKDVKYKGCLNELNNT